MEHAKRIASFVPWKHDGASPLSLANAGFTCTGDKVGCDNCGVELTQDKLGKGEVNFKRFHKVGCVFLPEVLPEAEAPTAPTPQPPPDMTTIDGRLSTYSTWKLTFIAPKELAECGFFYTGTDDKVKCAFCGGALYNWEHGDSPLKEHTKYFPKCHHVNTLVRNTLVRNTVPAVSEAAVLDEEMKSLIEDNKRLSDAQTCKMCMEVPVDTTFLPCGHLMACAECAKKVKNCPACRTVIRGTVKTFFQ